MKNVILHGVLLCVFACSVRQVWSMQNEPQDFQGVLWRTPFDNQRGEFRIITETGDSAYYRRSTDRPFFAGIEVRRISYHFYKGSFASGTILTVGSNDFKIMLAHLNDRYGPPQQARPRHRVYAWEGVHTGITISCDISISCYTEFFDRELRQAEMTTSGTDTAQDND